MANTRQLILEFLESKQIGTAPEIARAMNMTSANVRHHISILVDESAIVEIGTRRTKDRGRPSLLYALYGHARQHNLDQLSSALLDELLLGKTPDEATQVLKRLAGRLLDDNTYTSSLTQRLYKAILRLNEMHYDARWEAHADAPYLIFSFCPYAKILHSNPELCTLDSHLIEALLGRPARQIERLAEDERGATYCKFLISNMA
jgi:predicted ArsR family transcriptional regulator